MMRASTSVPPPAGNGTMIRRFFPVVCARAAQGAAAAPAAASRNVLRERRNPGIAHLLILVRLHARDADRADALPVGHDRQAALHRHARHLDEGDAAAGNAVFAYLGRAARDGGSPALQRSDLGGDRRGAVHARETEEMAAVVDYGDGDVPLVLARLGLAGGGDFGAVFLRENRLRLHDVLWEK